MEGDYVAGCHHNYPLSRVGEILLDQWTVTNYCDDPTISGVLADWLEENRSHLLSEGGRPDKLDELIQNLRKRCHSTAVEVGQ
jgi:hypothetical protein